MHPLIRQIPNLLSIARITATPILTWCAIVGAERAFTWVLVPALLTDMADGAIARRYGLTSKLGALLDSVADLLLFFVTCFGVWKFFPQLVKAHALILGLLVGIWATELGIAMLRYRRPSSFHTYASKLAAYLLAISVVVLFVWNRPTPLIPVAVVMSIAANLEELLILWRLPTWQSDVRGIYWVMRERSRHGIRGPTA